MLKPGTTAPDFKALRHDGAEFEFSAWRAGRPVVLYFYLKNFTAGWNRQAQGFRDAYEAIKGYGADLVGISPDRPDSHQRFRTRFSLPFTLLSDPDKNIARVYDVVRRFGLGISRVSYLIDKDGVVRDVFHHEVRIGKHVEDVLNGLKALDEGGPSQARRSFARAPGT